MPDNHADNITQNIHASDDPMEIVARVLESLANRPAAETPLTVDATIKTSDANPSHLYKVTLTRGAYSGRTGIGWRAANRADTNTWCVRINSEMMIWAPDAHVAVTGFHPWSAVPPDNDDAGAAIINTEDAHPEGLYEVNVDPCLYPQSPFPSPAMAWRGGDNAPRWCVKNGDGGMTWVDDEEITIVGIVSVPDHTDTVGSVWFDHVQLQNEAPVGTIVTDDDGFDVTRTDSGDGWAGAGYSPKNGNQYGPWVIKRWGTADDDA